MTLLRAFPLPSEQPRFDIPIGRAREGQTDTGRLFLDAVEDRILLPTQSTFISASTFITYTRLRSRYSREEALAMMRARHA